MLPTAYDRKPLLRSNSEKDHPGMRNWPLFGFLFALVFFFYIVYIYQAQSADLETLREQFDAQVSLTKGLKNDLIDAKSEIEKLKSELSLLKTDSNTLKSQYADCTASLRSCSLKSEQSQVDQTKKDEVLKEKETLIETLQKDASEVYSLRSLLSAQEKISEQLNKTVLLLQDEVNVLKSTKAVQLVTNAPEQKKAVDGGAVVTAKEIENKTTTSDVNFSTSSPPAAPKETENVVKPPVDQENQGKINKELNRREDNGKEVEEEPKEGVDQMEPPKDEAAVQQIEEEEKEEPAKVKGGDYDDKPDV